MKFGGPQSDEMAWVIVAHEAPLTPEKRVFELGCDGALDIARSGSTPPCLCLTFARVLSRHSYVPDSSRLDYAESRQVRATRPEVEVACTDNNAFASARQGWCLLVAVPRDPRPCP